MRCDNPLVMQLVDLRGEQGRAGRLPRASVDVTAVLGDVAPIVSEVAQGGDEAVLRAGERLDGVRPAALRVPAHVIAEAQASLDPEVRRALELAVARVRAVHSDQRAALADSQTVVTGGGEVTCRWLPVPRVGLYVPGGRAVYPSSVVMNAVPAQVAGVGSIAVTSPPQRDHHGWPHPTVLAACALLGLDEVYAAGGAQAIAMLAHGTGSCPPVDLVTGPGNVYVAAAKRLVQGRVGVDAEAGPTEIAIIADAEANADWVAADLISQAEHDVLAASVLITPSAELAAAVRGALAERLGTVKHREVVEAALSGEQSAILLVEDLDHAIAVANDYAPEHLEIHTRQAAGVAARITAAGCIFVGAHAPVPLGDYLAGSNHVLPTGGSARRTGGLSVATFLRCVTTVSFDDRALSGSAAPLRALAHAEDLPAHAQAVDARLAVR